MQFRENGRNIRKIIMVLTAVFGLAFSAMAQEVPGTYVYPERNQSAEKQAADEHACYSSAQNQIMSNPTPQEEPRKHKTAKRTAIGAGAGAILGGGKGAAIGAGAGAISGRRSKKRDRKEAEATESDDFRRAYSSCLKSKGYSVE